MPSEPTVEEVRELLDYINACSPDTEIVFSQEDANISANLCRHFLASQQPMTAGEFAGLVVRHFKDQEDNARGRIKTTKSKSWADHYLECIETAQHASRQLETVAREHNITIVEPKK